MVAAQKVTARVPVPAVLGPAPSRKGEGTRWVRKGRAFGLHRTGRLTVAASSSHKSSTACSEPAAVKSPG